MRRVSCFYLKFVDLERPANAVELFRLLLLSFPMRSLPSLGLMCSAEHKAQSCCQQEARIGLTQSEVVAWIASIERTKKFQL